METAFAVVRLMIALNHVYINRFVSFFDSWICLNLENYLGKLFDSCIHLNHKNQMSKLLDMNSFEFWKPIEQIMRLMNYFHLRDNLFDP